MIVRLSLAATLGVLAAVALGCGDRSNLIPGTDATGLQEQLDVVQAALADGDCRRATAAANDLEASARDLPTSIDSGLRARVREGAAKLVAEVPADCDQRTVETTPTQTQPEPTITETTPTETTPTETTPTTTVPPIETIPTIPEPDSGDGGLGDGTGGAGGPVP